MMILKILVILFPFSESASCHLQLSNKVIRKVDPTFTWICHKNLPLILFCNMVHVEVDLCIFNIIVD